MIIYVTKSEKYRGSDRRKGVRSFVDKTCSKSEK